MDPSADGFSVLSPAFGTAAEASERINENLKPNATQVARRLIPGTSIDVPSDAAATSDAGSRVATPSKQLSRQDSDFPPTPPTMTNSEISESIPAERKFSPSPVFADRAPQGVQRHKSGLSTPVNLSNSPPTPDPSPPNRCDTDQRHQQRPTLLQQNYASSYAESFQTATEENTTPAMVTGDSQVNLLLPTGVDNTPRQSWIEMGRAMGLSNKVLAVQEEDRAHHTDSETNSDIVSRVKNYHLESDGSDGEKDSKSELRSIIPSDIVQHWAASNDSPDHSSPPGKEESLQYSASDEQSTSDSNPVPPTMIKKSSSQRQAVAVPRLARPFQPGDDIKRPDSYLLYGSVGSVKKWKKPEPMSKTPPAREMDSEFLRNAKPVFQSNAPELPESGEDNLEKRHSAESGKDILQRLEDAIKEQQPQPAPLTALPPIPPEERQTITPVQEEIKPLQEFAPSTVAATKVIPSPPSTAQKERSLEDNNVVYKMIQEENAKRHSAISDGSVQARVVVPAEKKPLLRHTPKRDSLRGDVSMISSSDSVHRLRHKRRIGSLGNSEASPESARHSLHNVGNAQQVIAGTGDKAVHSSTRAGEKRFSYSAIRDSSPRVAPASALGNPHKLRRSLRHHSLEHTPRSVSDSARPLSMTTNGFAAVVEETTSLPKLRRSSAEHRLDRNNEVRTTSVGHVFSEQPPASPRLRKSPAGHGLDRNNDVRRTSLDHVPESKASPADPSPQLVAEELLQVFPRLETEQSPGQHMSERTPRRDRRESSEVSSKTAHSPRRKSVDYRLLHPTVTPMSQMSGTAASEAELCEAKGIPFFPHNNKSLLVVQTARHVSIPDYTPVDEDDSDLEGNPIPGIKRTNFKAFVTPADEIGKPLYSVESPLTNPREAPEPPVIKFIPPTPNDELERQLGSADERPSTSTDQPRVQLQRSLSLKDRIRRFGESLNQPVPFGRQNSYRRSAPSRRTPQAEAQRPTHLSSFWQPRDFWADYYSDDSDIVDDDDHSPLPPGGDTSEIVDEERRKRNAFSFPRAMSKRMPGFRGTGGFLMGNSLGIDRHGSNSRRHYVERRPNASHPSLRQYSTSTPNLTSKHSEEMLKRLHNRRTFKVPFSGGRRLEYVGFSAFGAKLQAKRKLRQERQAEMRREKLRESIGTRVYHDGPRMAGHAS